MFEIVDGGTLYPTEQLKPTNIKLFYEEISIGDRLLTEMKQSHVEFTFKIRIEQYKKINSRCVLKIDNEYHRVYNTFHFENKDGFKQTDITLVRYDQ